MGQKELSQGKLMELVKMGQMTIKAASGELIPSEQRATQGNARP
jgi:hypothetical protein